MDKFSEYANALLAELKKCHEETDINKPNIDHFLKKLRDGRETLTEQNRCECVRIFQELRSTLIELLPSCGKLTKLIDDGLKLLERLEENPQRLKNLKPAAYETEESLPGAQLRKGNRRGINTDSGLGLSRGSSIYSKEPSGSDFDVNARPPPSSPMEHEDETVSVNDLNSPRCEDRIHSILCPKNLSLGSLESSNEETMIDNEGVEVRYDQKIGAVPVVPPERDSAAFAQEIPETDISSIGAQAQAAVKQRRPRNRKDDSVIVMKAEENDENDECDVWVIVRKNNNKKH